MSDNIKKSPWISIWTNPGPTIRDIIDTNPKLAFRSLSFIYGLSFLLPYTISLAVYLKSYLFLSFLLPLIIAPFFGALLIYFYSWILRFTGKWLGGKAPKEHVRAAFAWSCVPLLPQIFLTILVFLLAFQAGNETASLVGAVMIIPVSILQFALGIWSIVILINNIAETQKFSGARAFGNWALYLAIVVIVYFTAFLSFFLISNLFH